MDPVDPKNAPPRPLLPPGLVAACFFGSGLTGLVYEIVWFRRLHYTFGSTTYSATTVLAAFMAGLGLGSFLVGRRVDRSRLSGVRIYAYLELAIGTFALLSLPLLSLTEGAFAWLQGWLELGPAGVNLLKLGLTFPVLALPAGMMGGTLPALIRGLINERSGLATTAGRLYGINTAGAALGTLLAGMLLIEVLGLTRSVVAAAAINLGIALVILARLRRARAAAEPDPDPGPAPAPAPGPAAGPAPTRMRQHLASRPVLYCLSVVALTGALSMLYEVVWTRVLVLVLGSSTYAFTIVLGIFLCGLALGALLYSRVAGRRPPSPADLYMLLLALALWAGVSLALIPLMPRGMLWLVQVPGFDFWRLLWFETLMAALLLFVPTLILGAALPLAMGLIARALGQVGQDVGVVYLVNTLGAIAGSVATGFVLIPLLGVQATLGWGLAANLAAVALGALLLPGPGRRRALTLAGAAAVGLLAVVQPPWPPVVFDAGLGHRHDREPAATRLELAQKLNRHPSRLRLSREGVNATITVRQLAGETVLYVNGKPDASTGVDMGTQALTGILPPLAHPAPRDVGIVGWGSGVSVYAATFFPEVRRIDAIEIERAVIEASPLFRPYNGGVEAHPRVNITYDDARSTLVSGKRPYDVIISEPSNPWMVGVSSLFSADFYRLVKRRLRPRGVFGQWFQLYNIDSRSVAMVFTTVLSSFRHVQLWFTDSANVILLASDWPLRFDLQRVRRAYRADPRLPLHMEAYGPGPRPEQLFGAFVLDGAALKRLVRPYGVEPLSDDLPTLEFRAARNLFHPVHRHIERLLSARLALGQVLPPGSGGGAQAEAAALAGTCNQLAGRAPRLEQQLVSWGIRRLPRHAADLRICHARGLLKRGAPKLAAAQLDALGPAASNTPAVRLLRARVALARGQAAEALELLARAGHAGGSEALWHTLRAAVEARQHALAWSLAEQLVRRLRRGLGDAGLRRISRGDVYDQIGRLMHASRDYRRAILLLGHIQERHGGELSRLLVLLDALRAAKDLPGAARVLDRLQPFGVIDAHHLQVCAQVYRKVGRDEAAGACRRLHRTLVDAPRQRPLWP